MNRTVTNVQQHGGTIVDVKREDELILYDQLPKRFRELIADLPVPQSIQSVRSYILQLGEEQAYSEIIRIFMMKFPGWVPNGFQNRRIKNNTCAQLRKRL